MTEPHLHASHSKVVSRLKRAEGHLHSVIAMIEGGRPCLELAQQLQAVERAVRSAKQALIHDHLDNCLDVEDETGRAERKAISRFL
ncbi:metal-sensing transcriptional repressor [Aliiroseovarius sp. xm-m-339-2]|uniref:metal-sensing transcriptional repressor n=1 Tax=Aliiroseovarius sp. xm-m-339-2 TaxID=2651829 RepID=UPI001569F888|nr:metal-sensing transcriptional repressor [Aliiroseovarius sp. xm-m-339-2]NRP42359.1 Copper-sensing transcriptional repressor CsoR [Aliiroseovarius sp. xm-m-339-2]